MKEKLITCASNQKVMEQASPSTLSISKNKRIGIAKDKMKVDISLEAFNAILIDYFED